MAPSNKQNNTPKNVEKTLVDELFKFTIDCIQEAVFVFNVEGSVMYQLFKDNGIFTLIKQNYEHLSTLENTELMEWVKGELLARDATLQKYLG